MLTGCIEENTDYHGNDLSLKENISSPSACACACSDNPLCSVFTWTEIDGICWLKKSDKGRKTSKGSYSGSLHCCTGAGKAQHTNKGLSIK